MSKHRSARLDWVPSTEPTEQERAVLRRYLDAVERADLAAMRTTMPPYPMWFQGWDAVLAALTASWDPGSPGYVGRFRMVPTGANRHPAAATYVQGPGDTGYHAFAIGVLRIEHGRIAELTAYHDPARFGAFGLPPTLDR